MKNNLYKAFTLVELIVVITILAVLATVAFISFQGYTSSSRDSVRLADLKNISKSFEINRTKDINFPLPDKKVDISASGTIFQYQGELSQNILESDLNIFDGGLDPVTKKPYGYAVNLARNKFQIIGFLENNQNVANILANTTFADNSDKYIKSSGDELGILLNETTNEVIVQSGSLTQIDTDDLENNYIFYLDNKNYISLSNSGISLNYANILNINSCKDILDNYPSELNNDSYYIINNLGVRTIVYCDMTTQGGGWTLFYANSSSPNMKIKKSYNQYLYGPKGINFDGLEFEDYNLNGMLNISGFKATSILAKDIGNWNNNGASVTFENTTLLNQFIENKITPKNKVNPIVHNDCYNLPDNSYFTYKTNDIEYTYNKITHRIGGGELFHGYGWRDCMVADGIIPPQSDDPVLTKPKDYPRHYFYKIDADVDIDRVRGIAGFNQGDASAIARYFVR